MSDLEDPKRQCARQPKQLASGVEIVGDAEVSLRVFATEYFLIGQAKVDGKNLLEIRLTKSDGIERRCLPDNLRQDDLNAAVRLVEVVRMLLRQP
ncbi:MAG: hypothetical protein EON90_05750 [Brevundimonas sp.]|nr:MAG: hypothetical protein EON90_05750 [Brevundimonas sp.]